MTCIICWNKIFWTWFKIILVQHPIRHGVGHMKYCCQWSRVKCKSWVPCKTKQSACPLLCQCGMLFVDGNTSSLWFSGRAHDLSTSGFVFNLCYRGAGYSGGRWVNRSSKIMDILGSFESLEEAWAIKIAAITGVRKCPRPPQGGRSPTISAWVKRHSFMPEIAIPLLLFFFFCRWRYVRGM